MGAADRLQRHAGVEPIHQIHLGELVQGGRLIWYISFPREGPECGSSRLFSCFTPNGNCAG